MELIKDKIGRELNFDTVELLQIFDDMTPPTPTPQPALPPIEIIPLPPDHEPPPLRQIRLVVYPTSQFDSTTLFNYIPQRFVDSARRVCYYHTCVVKDGEAVENQVQVNEGESDMEISDDDS